MAPRKELASTPASKPSTATSKNPRKASSPAISKKSAVRNIQKSKKRDDKPITKNEEKRAVRLRIELESIISDMRNEREIYGSLLQDLIPVRNRLEDLADIIKTGETITELRKASRSLREHEPEVWKKLVEDEYCELPDLGTPEPESEPETPVKGKKTPGGKRKKREDEEDEEFRGSSVTPGRKGKGGSSKSVEVTAASMRPQRTRKYLTISISYHSLHVTSDCVEEIRVNDSLISLTHS